MIVRLLNGGSLHDSSNGIDYNPLPATVANGPIYLSRRGRIVPVFGGGSLLRLLQGAAV
jgi:hypothetical protein